MNKLTKRAMDLAASTTGDTINPIVAGLLTSAAVVTRNPDLAWLAVPSGALAGALGEQGLHLVNQTLHDRAERVNEFTEQVAKAAGQPAEDFILENVNDAAKRELLGHIVAVAASARTAWKIKVLANAFVNGARDGDLIDDTIMFVDLAEKLEAGHVASSPPSGNCATTTHTLTSIWWYITTPG